MHVVLFRRSPRRGAGVSQAARPGKLEIQATKPLANQRDLALAYSPGVAAACTEIANNPAEAASLTSRANLVAVVSNGTAVLGLGNIGPLASKPVMEGKAVLFKKFAGIDVFDIEIAADTIERVVETVAALEPTFGGINLEDIKGPECFEIEAQLKERMKIPVFHDDHAPTMFRGGRHRATNGGMRHGRRIGSLAALFHIGELIAQNRHAAFREPVGHGRHERMRHPGTRAMGEDEAGARLWRQRQ